MRIIKNKNIGFINNKVFVFVCVMSLILLSFSEGAVCNDFTVSGKVEYPNGTAAVDKRVYFNIEFPHDTLLTSTDTEGCGSAITDSEGRYSANASSLGCKLPDGKFIFKVNVPVYNFYGSSADLAKCGDSKTINIVLVESQCTKISTVGGMVHNMNGGVVSGAYIYVTLNGVSMGVTNKDGKYEFPVNNIADIDEIVTSGGQQYSVPKKFDAVLQVKYNDISNSTTFKIGCGDKITKDVVLPCTDCGVETTNEYTNETNSGHYSSPGSGPGGVSDGGTPANNNNNNPNITIKNDDKNGQEKNKSADIVPNTLNDTEYNRNSTVQPHVPPKTPTSSDSGNTQNNTQNETSRGDNGETPDSGGGSSNVFFIMILVAIVIILIVAIAYLRMKK